MSDNKIHPVVVPEVITRMKAKRGLYVSTVPDAPGMMVPLYVDEHGQVWSMKLDEVLSVDGWEPDVQVSGPLTPDSVKI